MGKKKSYIFLATATMSIEVNGKDLDEAQAKARVALLGRKIKEGFDVELEFIERKDFYNKGNDE